jgi:uncharacterized DUF497 family protein
MQIVWDEPKRLHNLAKYGMDFSELTLEFFLSARIEATRQRRLLAIGRLNGELVIARCVPPARLGSLFQ